LRLIIADPKGGECRRTPRGKQIMHKYYITELPK